ncbi:MAG: MarR family transcriptional regulator [Bacteroidetes bacterium]|nr:MAG: MarR family transcriptional regulator [Bacteroidota bacterium]
MRIDEEIKQKKFVSPIQKAHLNVMFTSNWIIGTTKGILKPFGITHQQYNVLRILKGRSPEYCTADDVKSVMLDKSPDLTRLLDRLIDKGFVNRRVCEENRRKLDIGITANGKKLLIKIGPKIKSHHDKANVLTNNEAEELSRILDKLRG